MNTTAFASSCRRAAVALLAAGAGLTGVVAGTAPAHAAPAPHHVTTQRAASVHPDGWFTVQSCTTMSGSVSFQPGLDGALRKQTALLSATLDGCSFNGSAVTGQGTFNAVLTGKASKTTQSLSGTYTINWPAAEGLNPSTGKITLSGPNLNVVTLYGTGTAGAFTGLPVSSAYFITHHAGRGTKAHPIVRQDFVNTQPLQVRENLG